MNSKTKAAVVVCGLLCATIALGAYVQLSGDCLRWFPDANLCWNDTDSVVELDVGLTVDGDARVRSASGYVSRDWYDSTNSFVSAYLTKSADGLDAYDGVDGVIGGGQFRWFTGPSTMTDDTASMILDSTSLVVKENATFENPFSALSGGVYESNIEIKDTAATDPGIKMKATSDSATRVLHSLNGEVDYGDGTAAADTTTKRWAASQWGTDTGDDLVSGNELFLGGITGIRFLWGTAKPGTCSASSPRDIFIHEDGAAGDGFCRCTATDTWTCD